MKDAFFILLGYIGIGFIVLGQICSNLNNMAYGLALFCVFGIYCELN